tara:strand:+ start:3341 stop:4303 length:963 start_codon:yes stop_codon:yes gene_type:complete
MKWKKLGHIFDPTKWEDGVERPWMKTHSQSTSSLIFDDFVRIYFACRPDNDKEGYAQSYTTFLDLDRKDLTKILKVSTKPVMPLGELGTFDQHSVYPISVIRHYDEIRLYYAGWSRCKDVPFDTSIGLAISKDNGETFQRIGKGPLISSSPYEPFVISGPKVRKFPSGWFMYYLAGTKWINHNGKPEIIYKNKVAFSQDGLNWRKFNKNIIEDKYDENECQAGPDVFYYEDKYHMYFVYREGLDFRTKKGRGYKIGYATSTNGIDWKREDHKSGIEYSESGWDSEMHHYPHVFEVDGKYYMTYNGNKFGTYGFGLALLEN